MKKLILTTLAIIAFSAPSLATDFSEDEISAITLQLSHSGFKGMTSPEIVEQPSSLKNTLKGIGHAIYQQSVKFVAVSFSHNGSQYRCNGELGFALGGRRGFIPKGCTNTSSGQLVDLAELRRNQEAQSGNITQDESLGSAASN